ncbi:MAG: hypothetical protein ABEH90_11230 [Halolamina sp.]
MDSDTAVREIDEAVHKHVGGEDEGFRAACEAALSEVESVAGGDAVDDLTRFIDGYVREHEERPQIVEVDERAAEIVREHGESLPPDSYLQNV